MAFVLYMYNAFMIDWYKKNLHTEKINAIKLEHGLVPKYSLYDRYRHLCQDIGSKCHSVFCGWHILPRNTRLHRAVMMMKTDGTFANYILRSIVGFVSGIFLTYIIFMFLVFQLNFKLSSATLLCSIFGCILTIGLAFSFRVRCIVLMILPLFFSKRGRQALMAYAFILALTGPAKNTLHNMSILSESLACGQVLVLAQEQLKSAVKQILDVVKKPFCAIRDAIKVVVQVVKYIVRKIKNILMGIKRLILSIYTFIKGAIQWLGSVVNICNKKIGTPFQRCTRVMDSAILDCNAKLGPMFSWLCSATYIAKSLCYLVKYLDYVCMLLDYVNDSVVGTVIKKVRVFLRHMRAMFYVRITFSHSFQFETKHSKSLTEITQGILTEIRARTENILALFDVMSCATSCFFLFLVVRAMHYRYQFLTNERFDNHFITDSLRQIDFYRAKLNRETIFPLNHREKNRYIEASSLRLIKQEKVKLSKSAVFLGIATLKLLTHMVADYSLYWVLTTIRFHARFQNSVDSPRTVSVHVQGRGLLSDLYRAIVKAFNPFSGMKMDIDTVPCLPDPIPPDYDRYLQIASLIMLCWILAVFEPYGLRLRHSIMCSYNPDRTRQRAIWLYNHILRARLSFLKFTRRQLRRQFKRDSRYSHVTCLEYIRSRINNQFLLYILGEDSKQACVLCGEVKRDNNRTAFIKCLQPDCIGFYCGQCFTDLKNICTICQSPMDYGDLSDVSEEIQKLLPKAKVTSTYNTINLIKTSEVINELQFSKMFISINYHDSSDDAITRTGPGTNRRRGSGKPFSKSYGLNESINSNVSSSGDDTDYSYSYQQDKSSHVYDSSPQPFVDLEKQAHTDHTSYSSVHFSLSADQTGGEQPARSCFKSLPTFVKKLFRINRNASLGGNVRRKKADVPTSDSDTTSVSTPSDSDDSGTELLQNISLAQEQGWTMEDEMRPSTAPNQLVHVIQQVLLPRLSELSVKLASFKIDQYLPDLSNLVNKSTAAITHMFAQNVRCFHIDERVSKPQACNNSVYLNTQFATAAQTSSCAIKHDSLNESCSSSSFSSSSNETSTTEDCSASCSVREPSCITRINNSYKNLREPQFQEILDRKTHSASWKCWPPHLFKLLREHDPSLTEDKIVGRNAETNTCSKYKIGRGACQLNSYGDESFRELISVRDGVDCSPKVAAQTVASMVNNRSRRTPDRFMGLGQSRPLLRTGSDKAQDNYFHDFDDRFESDSSISEPIHFKRKAIKYSSMSRSKDRIPFVTTATTEESRYKVQRSATLTHTANDSSRSAVQSKVMSKNESVITLFQDEEYNSRRRNVRRRRQSEGNLAADNPEVAATTEQHVLQSSPDRLSDSQIGKNRSEYKIENGERNEGASEICNLSEDNLVACVEKSTSTNFKELAYQRVPAFSDLVGELERKLVERNKLQTPNALYNTPPSKPHPCCPCCMKNRERGDVQLINTAKVLHEDNFKLTRTSFESLSKRKNRSSNNSNYVHTVVKQIDPLLKRSNAVVMQRPTRFQWEMGPDMEWRRVGCSLSPGQLLSCHYCSLTSKVSVATDNCNTLYETETIPPKMLYCKHTSPKIIAPKCCCPHTK